MQLWAPLLEFILMTPNERAALARETAQDIVSRSACFEEGSRKRQQQEIDYATKAILELLARLATGDGAQEPAITGRCPHCSFDPTSLNDYCGKHRPKLAQQPPSPPTGGAPAENREQRELVIAFLRRQAEWCGTSEHGALFRTAVRMLERQPPTGGERTLPDQAERDRLIARTQAQLDRIADRLSKTTPTGKEQTCVTCRHTKGIHERDYRHLCAHPAMADANHGDFVMVPVFASDGRLFGCTLHEPAPPMGSSRETLPR